MRVPCTICGTEVLEATAKANDGLCAPCARGGGFCVICGKRVWEANRDGIFIHMDCATRQRSETVAATSGISWGKPDEIDWEILQNGIYEATRNCFSRLGSNHSNRAVEEVILAYRVGEGVRIEPCITFSDGEYLNASLDDESLLNELEPFDSSITRIEDDLDDCQREVFIQLLESRIPSLMQNIFDSLRKSDFELNLTESCLLTLKDF